MKGKFLVVVAVLIGIVVVVMINSTWKGYEERLNVPTRTFYRATVDVPPTLTVDQAMTQRYIVEVTLPESFARTYPYAVDEVQMIYQRKKRIEQPIKGGEFLQQYHLEPMSSDDIRLTIPAGHLVVSVPVTAESSLGYLISPGDLVDVVLVSSVPDAKGPDSKGPGGTHVEAKVLVSDARVYAVDALVGRADGVPVKPRGTAYGLVNLNLPPEEAMKLMAAKSMGKLSLILKSKKQG
jgi:Flp pilus assembly protein CpaB